MKALLAITMLYAFLCLGAASVGAESDSDSNKPPTESLKNAATKIGHAFRDATREIGHASRDAWHESAAERKDARNGAKTTWQSFKDGVRDAWRKVTGSANREAD